MLKRDQKGPQHGDSGGGDSYKHITMSDFIDGLNLITSAKIHELYAKQDTEDPLVLRKKVSQITPSSTGTRLQMLFVLVRMQQSPRVDGAQV